MTSPRLILMFSLIFPAVFSAFAADPQMGSADDAPFSISGATTAYIDNIEYSTPTRTGETFFGASARLRLFFKPTEHTLFEAGGYGLRRFGDGKFFSLTVPILRAEYYTDRISFILGEIVTTGNHAMPNLMFRQEYALDPGIEEGFQFKARYGQFNGEIWGAWDSLDSPKQREHFHTGVTLSLAARQYVFPLYLTAEHTGGELYSSAEPVQERFGGATGVSFRVALDNVLRSAFGQILAAGSSSRIRTVEAEIGNGAGVFAKAGVSPFGFDCSLQWFKGHNLYLSLGDPVFQTNRPFYALEISRTYTLKDVLNITGGWRFETPEVTSLSQYLKNPRYRFWLALTGEFRKKL